MKEQSNSLTVKVSNGLAVNVIPHPEHTFTMTTEQVAKGYGTSEELVRRHKSDHKDEFMEGKHYFTSVSIPHSGKPPVKSTHWTKRGVVRLGFFIKSEQAKLFRDWAEDFICRTVGLEDTNMRYINGFPVRMLVESNRSYMALNAFLRAINTKTSTPQTVKMLSKKGYECIKRQLPTDVQLTWYAPIEVEKILQVNTRVSKTLPSISTELMLALSEVEPKELRLRIASQLSQTQKGGLSA